MQECAGGKCPGNVRSNINMSGPPDSFDLPGRLLFAIGAAVIGEGGGEPGGHGDDQRDDRSTAPSTGMIAAMQFDETGAPKPPEGPPGDLEAEETQTEMAAEGVEWSP
eukprot:3300348-Pyramimonas_sp.AAC.1